MINSRAISFWVIGALCIFFGTLIAGNIEPESLGATMESAIIAYIIAFILILIDITMI